MGRNSPSKSRSRSPSRSASHSKSRSRSRSRSPKRRSRSPRRSSYRSRSRSRSMSPEGFRIHVADLGIDCTKRELEKKFERFGPTFEMWVARNPPCFAFIVYKYREDADEAIRQMDGEIVCKSRVRVSFARPRTRGRARRRGYDPNMRCYQCGERGHFSRDCDEVHRPGGYSRPVDKFRSYRSRSKDRVRRRSRSRSGDRRRSRSRDDKERKTSESPRKSPKKKTSKKSRSMSRSRSRSASVAKNGANSSSKSKWEKRQASGSESDRD